MSTSAELVLFAFCLVPSALTSTRKSLPLIN